MSILNKQLHCDEATNFLVPDSASSSSILQTTNSSTVCMMDPVLRSSFISLTPFNKRSIHHLADAGSRLGNAEIEGAEKKLV